MDTDLSLAIVVAVGPGNVIGQAGDMPWDLRDLPSDVRRFKSLTTQAGVVIMGRKTHESILRTLGHPLRERHSIVLTRSVSFEIDGVEIAASVEDACRLVRMRGGKACVIGGAEIYKAFLPLVSCIKMTHVDAPGVTGDTYFPAFDSLAWSCQQRLGTKHYDERDRYPTSYEMYKRVA